MSLWTSVAAIAMLHSATRASLPLILRVLAPNKESLGLLHNSATAQDRITQLVKAIQTGQASVKQLQQDLDGSRGDPGVP